MESFRIIGERIRAARRRKGLTQTELADLTKHHLQTIARWERGERSPITGSLERVAEALGVRSGWLISGEGEMDAPLFVETGSKKSGAVGLLLSKTLADQVARFVIDYQQLMGELDPGTEAALTVLLYRECERLGLADPKKIPSQDLISILAKAAG